jgi:hypothetical protein
MVEPSSPYGRACMMAGAEGGVDGQDLAVAMDAYYREAAAAIESATGRAYEVWQYSGDPDTADWDFPVYAAPADGDDLGHALADAGAVGCTDWLIEQAMHG